MSVVLYEKKGRIAYITLNRPEKLNAINDEIIDGLQKAWIDFRDDDDLWAAILAGNGKAFCAGADIARGPSVKAAPIRPGPPPNVIRATSKALRTAPTAFEVWKPVICALHGYVYGAGTWLALNCDMRVAAEGTKFCIPEVRFSRAVNFAALVSQYIPMGIARDMMKRIERIFIDTVMGMVSLILSITGLLSGENEFPKSKTTILFIQLRYCTWIGLSSP